MNSLLLPSAINWFSKPKWTFKSFQKEKCNTSYHALFEQATDPIMVTDYNGNFIDVNSSLCSLFGYKREELAVSNVRILLDQEHIAAKPLQYDLLRRGENVFNERKMVTKDGTVIFVEANAKKFAENRVLVIARNITERKIVEEGLKASEANLQTILNNTDTVYVLMDNDLKIISYNSRAVQFARSELGHTIKMSEYFLEYFPEEKQETLRTSMMAVLNGQHINYDVAYAQPDSAPNWYHIRIFPISRPDNNIFGLMMAVSDITQKKLLERELLNQKLKEQRNVMQAVLKAQEMERNRLGQELHDNINQILTSVKLYLSLMEQEVVVSNELMCRSKELLDLSIKEIRLLSQQQVTPQKKFQLRELIEDLARDLNKNQLFIDFQFKIAEELAIDEDLKLNIYRIVQEQFNNIIKYSEARTAMTLIAKKEDTIIIEIWDDGKGFDPLVKRKGLGISNIVNRVESYNGKVYIESKPGEGCLVKISIPFE